MKCQKLKEGFKQVCVWPGTIIKEEQIPDFHKFMKDELNTRTQFLETIITKPDVDDLGNNIPGTGGRHDVLFAVHSKDINNFSIKRLPLKISWVEDVLSNCNYNQKIYPNYIFNYVSWNHENINFPKK